MDPNSSPPRTNVGSSPRPLCRQAIRMHLEESSDADDGVQDDIFNYRKSQYAEMFPSYSSSPTRLRRGYGGYGNRQAAQRRSNNRDHGAMEMRGGIEEMEKFVMNSERERELQNLRLQAEGNAISAEQAEEFENEQREEMEDEQLLEYVVKREQCMKELDQMLGDLFIT